MPFNIHKRTVVLSTILGLTMNMIVMAKQFDPEPMDKNTSSTDTELFQKAPRPPASPMELPAAKEIGKTTTPSTSKKKKSKKAAYKKPVATPTPTPTPTPIPEEPVQ